MDRGRLDIVGLRPLLAEDRNFEDVIWVTGFRDEADGRRTYVVRVEAVGKGGEVAGVRCCEFCGADFEGRALAKFCSGKCRQRNHRSRTR